MLYESPIWICTENIVSPQYIKTENFQKAENDIKDTIPFHTHYINKK